MTPKLNFSTPFCKKNLDIENERCVLKIGKKIIEKKIESKCKKSCSNLNYLGQVSMNMPMPQDDQMWNTYFLSYTLTNDEFMANVYEEYIIYDTFDMIGSVGGTMGMFVGFSMTGVISLVINYLKN